MWANAAAILSLSLAPVRHDEPVPLTCLICGWEGASDFILNLGFYLPLGVALWCALRRPGRAVALALLLSAAVELAQLVIPGRDSTLGDLVANTLGAAAGVALARHAAAWAAPSPRAAGWMSLGAALAALGVIALTGVAAAPAFPRAPLRAEWAARTESLARYHGRVLSASVGAIPLAPAAEGDRETVPAPVLPAGRIRQAFLSGAAVRVRAVAGPPPRALAQLLGIYRPALQSEVLLVGIDGEDVVVRVRSRAVPLRLRSPEMRFRRALAGVQPGDTFSLAVRRVRGGIEVRRGGGGGTRLGVTPGGGWAMLYGVDRAAPPLLAALGAAWMALLMLPLGLWLRATRLALLPLTITAAGLAALPPAVGLMPARWWEIGGALAGIGLGAVIARVSRPRSRR